MFWTHILNTVHSGLMSGRSSNERIPTLKVIGRPGQIMNRIHCLEVVVESGSSCHSSFLIFTVG